MAIFNDVLVKTYNYLKSQSFLLGSSHANSLKISNALIEQQPLFLKELSNGITSDMSVNGSVTPVDFFVQPPVDEVWYIAKWMLYLQDGKGFDITTWGSNGALTNGLDLKVEVNGVTVNQLDFPVKHNGDIARIAYDMQLHEFGNGDDILTAQWSFTEMGQFLRLDGATNDKLIVTVQDDLTGITTQHIHIQGFKA